MILKKSIILIILAKILFADFAYTDNSHRIKLNAKDTGLEMLRSTPDKLNFFVSIDNITGENIIANNKTFSIINIDGASLPSDVGLPQIPVFSELIEVPYHAEIQIQINRYDKTEIFLSDYGLEKIFPTQKSYSKSTAPEDVQFKINKKHYQNNNYDDIDIVKSDIYGFMRGVRIGRIEVRPYRYNPVKNSLIVYNNLEFSVKFVNADHQKTAQQKAIYQSVFFNGILNSTLINYNQNLSRDLITDYNEKLRYVIVSNREFESNLQPLVSWKTKKGFDVVEAYTDIIGGSNTEIQAYLQDLYDNADINNPAPLYLLIIGDHSGPNSIPAFESKASTPSDNHITDLYFACFDGDDDFLPDMYYGRISVTTAEQLDNVINKIIPYERYEFPNDDFLDKAMLIAGTDNNFAASHGDPTIFYAIDNYYNSDNGYSDVYAYYYSLTDGPYHYMFTRNNATNAAESIKSKITQGVGFANYTAHCSSSGWSSPSVSNTDIDLFDNIDKYPFMIGNCCQSYRFNLSDAFGEKVLYAKDKGAIGYIGASNNTYWTEDVYWGIGLTTINLIASNAKNHNYDNTGLGVYDGIWHQNNEDYSKWYYTGGQMIHRGNLEVLSSTSNYKRYYWEVYHLSGDPSLTPYNTIPQEINIAYHEIYTGATQLQVNSETYTYIAISQNDSLLDAKWTGSGNSVILSFDSLQPYPVNIVASKQNRIPYINENISPITPGEPLANFSADNTEIVERDTVFFTDASDYAAEWEWDFGDGNNSNIQNPYHKYTQPGLYTVSLKVKNAVGEDVKTKVDYIKVNQNINPPIANFEADKTHISPGTSVNFTDISENIVNEWYWQFEGGEPNESNQENPTVVYNEQGKFSVMLKVSNDFGEDSIVKHEYIDVGLVETCEAHANNPNYMYISNFKLNTIDNSSSQSNYSDFTHIGTQLAKGITYNFTINIENSSTYDQCLIWIDWDGNGVFEESELVYISETGLQDQHTGSITVPEDIETGIVRLRIRIHYNRDGFTPNSTPCGVSGFGEVEDYRISIVSAEVPPIVDFYTENISVCTGEVTFSDQSQLGDEWLWDFGDGNYSNLQNPVHTYNASGNYDVKLTVFNQYGQSEIVKTNYIQIQLIDEPVLVGDIACGSSELTLSAESDYTVKWFDEFGASDSFHTGETYTNFFESEKTFYVQAFGNIPFSYFAGKPDNSGVGEIYNGDTLKGLVFDAYRDFTLKSVKLYSGVAKERTISVINQSEDTIYSENIFIPSGESRLELNFDIPQGNNYTIIASEIPGLYINGTADSNELEYPFVLNDIVSIKSNTSEGTDDNYLNFYYYFYDWEIEIEKACNSPIGQIQAVIFPLPEVDLGDDIEECGGTVTLTVQDDFNSYSWNGIPGTYHFTTDSTTTVYLEVVDDNNCSASDEINITILPEPEIEIESKNETYQGAEDGEAYVVISEGTEPYVVNWCNSSDLDTIYNLSGGMYYYVSVTDYNNCEVTDSVFIDIDVFPPTAEFIADTTRACDSLYVKFTDLSLNNPESWYWDFGDGNYSESQNPEYLYELPGIYSVKLTVSNLAGIDSVKISNYIEIGKTPEFNIITEPASFLDEPDGRAEVEILDDFHPYTVLWSDESQGLVNENLLPGDYYVTVIDAYECSNSKPFTINIFSTVQNQDFKDVKIYPNPAEQFFYIKFNDVLPEYVQIKDISQKIIKQKQVNAKKLKIDVSNFNSGVYFVFLKSNNQITILQVVVL